MARPFQPFEPHGRGGPRIGEIPLRLLVPNVVTVLAICAGLTGIRLAFEARFEIAVVMVLVAAFLDGIDGRLARMLKASSKFGAQMDSLADIVNFGVAPAFVLYLYLLKMAAPFGWIAVLVFTIASGLRLARFNVLDDDHSRPAWQGEYFVGVPAPAGAVLVMLPIYLGFLGIERGREFAFVGSLFAFCVAFLLVSRLPVYSGKKIRVGRDKAVPLIFAIVLFVFLLLNYTWQTISVAALGYLVFLPLSARAYSRRARLEEAAQATATGEGAQ